MFRFLENKMTNSPFDIAALTNWFEANVEEFIGPIDAQKFAGGQYKPYIPHKYTE